MNREQLKDKLDNLMIQQRQAEAAWSKIQGAIEFCKGLLEEQSSNNSNNNNGTAKKKEKKAVV